MLGINENPVEQTVQLFAESHLLQLREELQRIHPTSAIILHVNPAAQHPCDEAGRKEKPGLQEEHVLAESHRAQFKVEEQVAQPIPGVVLKVNPEAHEAQVEATSQRMQFREEVGQVTHAFVVLLAVVPSGQTEQMLEESHLRQLRARGQDMHVPT